MSPEVLLGRLRELAAMATKQADAVTSLSSQKAREWDATVASRGAAGRSSAAAPSAGASSDRVVALRAQVDEMRRKVQAQAREIKALRGFEASHYPPGTVPADGLDVPEDPLMSSYSHHTHSVDPIRGGGGGALSRSVLSRSASAAAAAATVKRPNARTTEADVVDTTHDTELPGGCADVIQRHARVVGAVFDQYRPTLEEDGTGVCRTRFTDLVRDCNIRMSEAAVGVTFERARHDGTQDRGSLSLSLRASVDCDRQPQHPEQHAGHKRELDLARFFRALWLLAEARYAHRARMGPAARLEALVSTELQRFQQVASFGGRNVAAAGAANTNNNNNQNNQNNQNNNNNIISSSSSSSAAPSTVAAANPPAADADDDPEVRALLRTHARGLRQMYRYWSSRHTAGPPMITQASLGLLCNHYGLARFIERRTLGDIFESQARPLDPRGTRGLDHPAFVRVLVRIAVDIYSRPLFADDYASRAEQVAKLLVKMLVLGSQRQLDIRGNARS